MNDQKATKITIETLLFDDTDAELLTCCSIVAKAFKDNFRVVWATDNLSSHYILKCLQERHDIPASSYLFSQQLIFLSSNDFFVEFKSRDATHFLTRTCRVTKGEVYTGTLIILDPGSIRSKRNTSIDFNDLVNFSSLIDHSMNFGVDEIKICISWDLRLINSDQLINILDSSNQFVYNTKKCVAPPILSHHSPVSTPPNTIVASIVATTLEQLQIYSETIKNLEEKVKNLEEEITKMKEKEAKIDS